MHNGDGASQRLEKQLYTDRNLSIMRFNLLIFAAILFNGSLVAQTSQEQLDYIKNFHEIAISEMIRSGIPASIKLAQGILESDAGRSVLARRANNHFGIKCGQNWNGDEVYREDDDYDDRGQLIKSCFRGYRNANASYVAHSEFLRDPSKAFRYGFLFRLDPKDYKNWAEGLRRAGYATNPNYPNLLIGLIERYNLQQYDQVTSLDDQIPTPTRPGTLPTGPTTPTVPGDDVTQVPDGFFPEGIFNENDVTYFISGEALSIEEVGRRVDVSVRRLLEYNESLNSEQQKLLPGQRVFLQKKRNSYRGKATHHTVLATDNLQAISDRYAVRMDKLLKRNRLTSANQRVAPGEKIKLRGGKVSDPPRLGGVPIVQPNSPTIPTDKNGNLDIDTDNPIPSPTSNPGSRPSTPVTPSPQPPLPGNSSPDFGSGGTVTPAPTTPTPAPPVTPTPTPTPNPGPVVNPTPPVPAPAPPTTQPTATNQFHSVVKGDTLYNISRRYGKTVEDIKRLNGLTSNTISIGQQLRVQ